MIQKTDDHVKIRLLGEKPPIPLVAQREIVVIGYTVKDLDGKP